MSDERVAALVQTHIGRYPELDIADVYKLLHQGVFGPGHSIPNRKAAREWLEQEAKGQAPEAGLLTESIHPDRQIVRLHIRPYLFANGDLNALLEAYVKSGDAVQGSAAQMAEWWGMFEKMVASGGALAGRFEARAVGLVGRTRASEHWAASHHSPIYNARYKPVYRVLTREHAEALLQSQAIPIQIG